MKVTASTPIKHKPKIVDDEYLSPTYFDSPAFKEYQKMVEKVVLKSKVRLSTSQIKRMLGDKFEERYNLLDVLESSEVLEWQGTGLRTWAAKEPTRKVKPYSPEDGTAYLFRRSRKFDKTFAINYD